MKRKNEKDIEASLKSKMQAYLVMAGVVIAAAGILYWNYFQTQVPSVSEKTIKENFHTPLDPSLVCMVNDAYMGEPQIPVPVNGKTYYGCCQMCVKKLNEEESARMATDPFNGQPVDKSEAYIVLLNEQGEVAYFESETNYKAYTKSK